MQIPLPWPPTANHYYRHVGRRVLISAAGRRYREAVGAILHHVRAETLTGPVELTLHAWPPDRRERDLDNLCKAIQDALQHGGAFRRDSQIRALHVIRYQPRRPGYVLATILPATAASKPCPILRQAETEGTAT